MDNILQGLSLMAMGMGTVFLFLMLLILAVKLSAYWLAPSAKSSPIELSHLDSQNEPSQEVIAVISAAVYRYRKDHEGRL